MYFKRGMLQSFYKRIRLDEKPLISLMNTLFAFFLKKVVQTIVCTTNK